MRSNKVMLLNGQAPPAGWGKGSENFRLRPHSSALPTLAEPLNRGLSSWPIQSIVTPSGSPAHGAKAELGEREAAVCRCARATSNLEVGRAARG